MTELQKSEIYLFFYNQLLIDFIFTFIDSPQTAVDQLSEKIPGSEETFQWAQGFNLPPYEDKEKQLFRAVKDATGLMSEHLRTYQKSMISEVETLLHFRTVMETPASSMEYLYWLEEYRKEKTLLLS